MACNFCLQAIEFQAELARPAGFEPTTAASTDADGEAAQ
jgi:hypothetical protein